MLIIPKFKNVILCSHMLPKGPFHTSLCKVLPCLLSLLADSLYSCFTENIEAIRTTVHTFTPSHSPSYMYLCSPGAGQHALPEPCMQTAEWQVSWGPQVPSLGPPWPAQARGSALSPAETPLCSSLSCIIGVGSSLSSDIAVISSTKKTISPAVALSCYFASFQQKPSKNYLYCLHLFPS